MQRTNKLPSYLVNVGDPSSFGVEVGTPKIETPQYSVEVGEPRIEQSSAALAALRSNDDRIRAAIASKLSRAPVLGIKDDSLLGMDKLAKVGIGAQPNEQGLPYGLDPRQLNPLEMRWLMRQVK